MKLRKGSTVHWHKPESDNYRGYVIEAVEGKDITLVNYPNHPPYRESDFIEIKLTKLEKIIYGIKT
jgi:hypothetical protein